MKIIPIPNVPAQVPTNGVLMGSRESRCIPYHGPNAHRGSKYDILWLFK